MAEAPGEIAQLLRAWADEGDRQALDRLLPLVLDELRRLAAYQFKRQGSGHTLQPTALVHEAYLRLVGSEARGFENRHQVFALASRLIRDVLVDHARAKRAQKRGGERQRVPLLQALGIAEGSDSAAVLAVHQALERLEALDSRQGRVVELRFFGGLTLAEVASVLELPLATVERDWSVARRWLAREIARTT